jgi:alpha-L-rhamnosidase
MADRSGQGPEIGPLRVHPGNGLLGLPAGPFTVSWAVTAPGPAARQTAYEVQVARDPGFGALLASSGEVEGDEQVAVRVPGPPLGSREERHLRVRSRLDHTWTPWSESVVLEGGLLTPGDWQARAIGVPSGAGAPDLGLDGRVVALRCSFQLDSAPARARLYVTSLGVHEVLVNGRAAAPDLLNPGWSSYRARLLVATHDVTALLRRGENTIGALLADGWYRGRLGWEAANDRHHYGDRVALLAQLEVVGPDGRRTVVGTDESWRAGDVDIVRADLYDGTAVDLSRARPGWSAPGFDDSGWPSAEVTSLDVATLEPRIAAPVRPVAVLPMRVVRAGEGTTLLDAGQNLAGVVRLAVTGPAGATVRVRHAEVLEADGALHTAALRSAQATDSYVLAAAGDVQLEPSFTFHGFRYAQVETRARVLTAQAVAVSTDLAERSTFACSDPVLTRLHENVRWSQRSNFVSLPTDCPQRDERLGWTGDAQAFAPTACTLFDARDFWRTWLRDLRAEQRADGAVPSVVPDVVLTGDLAAGRAGWGDAITMVPWAVYEAYGDVDILSEHVGGMRRWVDHLASRTGEDGLLGDEPQFGDWLDPDAPPERPWEATTRSDFLSNAYFAHSARLTARAMELLGDPGSDRYGALADTVAAGSWSRWGVDVRRTQTGCAVAIAFDLVPPQERARVGADLARLVRAGGGAIRTGFLGTPLVLPALAATGHLDEAYLMLLRRQSPSWLYQVERGATTVWERWDAIRPDGSLHDGRLLLPDGSVGHMLSFNHYAYGSVVDWVYRWVAGLSTDTGEPGYRKVVLRPRPATGITWATATVEADQGPVSVTWDVDDAGSFTATYDIPFGCIGHFVPPASATSTIEVAGRRVHDPVVRLLPGRHRVVVSDARIARPDLLTDNDPRQVDEGVVR